MTDVDYRNENRNKKDEEVTEKEQRCIIVMKARPEIIIIIKKKNITEIIRKTMIFGFYLPSLIQDYLSKVTIRSLRTFSFFT